METRKLKILLMISRPIYPVNGGDRVRIDLLYRIAKELGQVTVAANLLWFENFEPTKKKLISQKSEVHEFRIGKVKFITNLIRGLLKKEPVQNAIYKNKKAKNIIDSSHYDLVICHLSRTHNLIPLDNSKTLVDLTDNLLLHYSKVKFNWTFKSLFFKLELPRFKRYYKGLPKESMYSFISERDKLSNNDIVILNDSEFENNIYSKDSKNLLFIGNMESYPNFQAVENFINLNEEFIIKNGFRLYVLGKGAYRLRNLKLKWIYLYEDYNTVSEVDTKFRFGIAPMLSGAGLQNKVLDYIRHGLPTIATSIVTEAFPINNEILLTEDRVDRYADIIKHWHLNASYEEETRRFLSQNFSFEKIRNGITQELKERRIL